MSSDGEDEPMTARRSTPRRTAAAGRKRKISYRESTDEEDLENMEYEQELMVKKEPDNSGSEIESESGKDSDDDGSDSVEAPQKSRQRSPAKQQAKQQGSPATKNNTTNKQKPTKKANLTCPHCSKTFAVMNGLTYHVDNFVCRKDQRPNNNKQKSRKKPNKKEEEEQKVSDTYSDSETDNGSTEESKKPPARKSKKKPIKKEEEEEEVSDNDDNSDDDFSEPEEALPPKRKRTKLIAAKTKDSNDDLKCEHCEKKFSTEYGLAYHIDKKVCRKTKQPATTSNKKPASKNKPTKRPPASKASGAKWKKFRGAKEDRTCPNCKRVFTSVLGKDYHCANRVCETKKIEKPFETLAPGKKFVTQWGVVEVVKDERATPTAEMDPKANAGYRQWKNQRIRLEMRRKEQYFSSTVHSLARRKRFGALYLDVFQRPKPPPPHTLKKIIVEDENKAQRETWKIYTGTSDWRNRPPGIHRTFPHVSPELPTGPHPLEPDGSHPDRMVECVLIPDRRKWLNVEGLGVEDPTDTATRRECVSVEKEIHSPPGGDTAKPTRLFLQRRLLTEPYVESSTRFCCVDCGRLFGSIVGCKYHVTSWACHRASGRSQTKPMTREDINAQLERHVGILMDRQENPDAATDPQLRQELGLSEGPDRVRSRRPSRKTADAVSSGDANAIVPSRDGKGQFRATGEKRKWLPKKKREWAFYPQVWRSLGFKVVPKKPRAAPVSFFKKRKHEDGVYPNAQLQNRINDADDLHRTLKSFTEELVDLRSETLGAYYPGVWKVLRFRKPSKKPFFVRRPGEESDPHDDDDADDDMEPVGAKRAPSPPPFVPQPPPFAYGPPVIIDVAVLAAEVDAGRYPSMKRINCNNEESGNPNAENPEEEGAEENTHDDKCYMCKDSRGILYLCDFCKKVNHLLCIRTRFLVKEPEPHDDFMCNKCIQYILQRRRRAERRRLRRCNGGELPESALGFQLLSSKEASDPASEEAEEAKQVTQEEVSDDPAPGEEFNYLAKQGQSVDQIVELLKDAQSRLQLLVETSKINDFRRSQFDGE